MTDAAAWVEARLAGAPPSLRSRVLASVRGELARDASPVPVFETRAEALAREAAAGPPTTDTALTLLAADALITLAAQWEAETPGRDGVG